MDSGASTPRRHGRNVSHGRIDLPRRNTRDPLQANDDPLTIPHPIPRDLSRSPALSSAPSSKPSTPPILSPPPRDLSFLHRPENYHPVPAQGVPPPFRQPLPDASASLPDLLAGGQFRAAAHVAALRLVSQPAPPEAETLSLVYTRLASLCLIGHTDVAATESRALQDLGGSYWMSGQGGRRACVLPWELRVLATRLQAIGVGDPRRAVTGYYDLARVARLHAKNAGAEAAEEERGLWRARLLDLGVRVGNMLVEVGDVTGAVRHLESLDVSGAVEGEARELVRGRLGLLYLRLGRLADARRFIVGDEAAGSYAEVLRPLLSVAEGNHSSAAKQLDATGSDTLAKSNLAVTLLYSGEMRRAREILEGLVEEGENVPVLLFNLSTIFELCTERPKVLKAGLVEEVAKMEGNVFGWERSMQDFKL